MNPRPLSDHFDADEPRWDLLDGAGRLLLVGVTHRAAWLAAEQLRCIPGWMDGARELRYIRQRDGQARAGLLWDWRHEGPLVLVARADGDSPIMARSHIGLCGIPLEEAMRRLEQFSAADQADLLSGLPCPPREVTN